MMDANDIGMIEEYNKSKFVVGWLNDEVRWMVMFWHSYS